MLEHPNIVRYLGHQKGEHLSIILEYMPCGSIKDRLQKYGAFTEITTKRYTRDILKGLAYLHTNKIIHSDIKGGNILLSCQDTAKLADFGVSKELRSSTVTSGGNTKAGTARFMAPEVVKCGESEPRFGRKSDVWSVGCAVVQMLMTYPPWESYKNGPEPRLIFAIASKPVEYELPATVSENAKEFVQDCFIENPKNRPKAETLLDYGFVKVQPDMEWHDILLHILSNMLTEEDFKELKRSFCHTGEMTFEAFFGLLESDELISVGQYDALIKHLETMHLEACIRVISEYTEKIQDYRQMLTRQATNFRYVAPPSADVNKYDEEGETPLMRAAENNDVARVRSLIEAGADLDMKSTRKCFFGYVAEATALMIASWKGHTEVVAGLIKAGANVDIQDKYGSAALILAAQFGHKEVVANLIESGADVNIRDESNGMSALGWAMINGHREVAEMLKSAGATR